MDSTLTAYVSLFISRVFWRLFSIVVQINNSSSFADDSEEPDADARERSDEDEREAGRSVAHREDGEWVSIYRRFRIIDNLVP